MTFADLDRFFRPRRVAVVGATDEPERQTTHQWRQLSDWGRRVGAEVVPVHPRRARVDGVATRASLSDIAGAIDVVAILHAGPEEVAAEAARVGAGFVVVFAAGYAETGEDGATSQQRLLEPIRRSSTRLIGPNTNLNAFAPLDADLPGPGIAIISQSGHMGRPLYLLQDAGVRITHWAPTGNEADVDAADVLAWFAEQDEVDAVALYLEGIGDGTRFVEAARRSLAAGKPVIAVKVGRTAVGAGAASSHTAAVTSPDAVVDAAFDRAGIVRADDLDDLADTTVALARLPEPRTDGVAVYAMSGGACSLTADHLAFAGLPLPELGSYTRAALRERIAGFLPVSNPVDCGGPPMADERGREILDLLAEDPSIGAVVTAVSGAVPGFTDRLVDDLVATAEAHPDVAFVLVWGTPHLRDDDLERAQASPNLAVFRSARDAATALTRWQTWHANRHLRSRADTADVTGGVANRSAQEIEPEGHHGPSGTAKESWPSITESSEWRSRQVLADAGIAQAPAELVTDPAEASGVVRRLGGVAVLKADVAGLAHRGMHGLVEIGVTPDGAREAAEALLERARRLAGDRVLGLTVAAQVQSGPEVLVGAVHDPVFGPVVTVGHGGSDVEALGLTAVALAPRSTAEAEALVARVPHSDLWRADPTARHGLVDIVTRIAELAHHVGPDLAALELNPVRLLDGEAIALDAWLGVMAPTSV